MANGADSYKLPSNIEAILVDEVSMLSSAHIIFLYNLKKKYNIVVLLFGDFN